MTGTKESVLKEGMSMQNPDNPCEAYRCDVSCIKSVCIVYNAASSTNKTFFFLHGNLLNIYLCIDWCTFFSF